MRTPLRSLITAIALASAVVSANAGSYFTIKRSGFWTTYYDVSTAGRPMVGMSVDAHGAGFHVKYFNDQRLYVQLMKNNWQFPKDGVAVPFRIAFDNSERTYPASGQARMDRDTGMAVVEASMDDPKMAGVFVADIMNANTMTVTFEQGDEEPWVADMTGSRDAGRAFLKATIALDKIAKPTQPYDKGKSTQPYKTTQPYNLNDGI